jgi:hypothetical protein
MAPNLKDDPNELEQVAKTAEEADTVEEAQTPDGAKEDRWRVIVYMSADADNLQRPLQADLAELARPLREMPAEQSRPYVIVEIETPSGLHKRCDITDGTVVWLRATPAPENPLISLIAFARERWPNAIQDALVLWGHSAGAGTSLKVPEMLWSGPERASRNLAQLAQVTRHLGAGFKQLYGVNIRDALFELKPVLQRPGQESAAIHPPIGLILADTCFLGGLEWALGLRKLGDWMLAAQGSIAFESMPLDVLIEALIADPAIKPRQLGRRLVDQIDVFRKSPAALALYDLRRAVAVRRALYRLLETLERAQAGNAKSIAGWPINGYAPKLRLSEIVQACAWTMVRQFIDLTDLANRLASQGTGHEMRDAARALLGALSRLVVDRATKGAAPLGGVSIFCPWVRATDREVAAGARNLDLDDVVYARFDLRKWRKFVFAPQRLQDAQQRNLRREMRENVRTLRNEYFSRDTKPWGMDTKPSGMDTKPSGMDTKPSDMGLDPA